MKKSLAYYKFIAPARLISRGIAPTKENVEAEIRRLKEEDEKSQNN